MDINVTLLQSFLIQNDIIFLSQLRNVIQLKFLGHREGAQLTGKEYSNNRDWLLTTRVTQQAHKGWWTEFQEMEI